MSDASDALAQNLAAVADARFHSLAYMMDDAVVVVDATNRVRFANPSADRLFEAAAGDLVGAPFLLPLRSTKSGPVSLDLASGRRIDLQCNIASTVWDGEIAWLATFRDAAPPRTLGPEAMETVVEVMRGRFLSHLSHELRTPLNTVLGFSEAMVMELFGALGHDRYRSYANDIHGAGQRLLKLLNDLLDLARADTGDLALDESLFDLSEVVADALPEARESARRTNARVAEIAVEPVLMRGDRAKLRRALVHLLANGLSFTPADGEVRVSSSVTNDGRLLIRVADTGRGFAREELGQAFRPFPRVRSVERADPLAGPGVGLALVRRYIELHGGTVRIDTEQGQGTTITCALPPERVALDLSRSDRATTH